jgi:hypothetical protein
MRPRKIVSNIKPESQEYRIVISYTSESNKPIISNCSSVWKRETEEDESASLRSMDYKIVVVQKIEETIIILLVKWYPKCDYVWS